MWSEIFLRNWKTEKLNGKIEKFFPKLDKGRGENWELKESWSIKNLQYPALQEFWQERSEMERRKILKI